MPKLTDRAVKALEKKKVSPGKRYQVMDAQVSGFGVRVTDRGERSYILYTRYPGRPGPARRLLGRVGTLTLAEARDKARRWLALIERGVDPAAEEERARREKAEQRENSFAAVAREFIRLAVIGSNSAQPKQRKGLEVARDIEREFISRWGKRRITDITSRDVSNVVKAAVERGSPYQAHNLLAGTRGASSIGRSREALPPQRPHRANG